MCRSSVSRLIRYASVQKFWRVYVLPLLSLFARFYNTLELSFVLPYNHLLFLAKTNKENDNNIIDFSLLIGQNLKKYSSILD
jgi:hypothetical protein